MTWLVFGPVSRVTSAPSDTAMRHKGWDVQEAADDFRGMTPEKVIRQPRSTEEVWSFRADGAESREYEVRSSCDPLAKVQDEESRVGNIFS